MHAHLSPADPFATTPVVPPKARPNQFVTFSAGDKAFGVDIMSVREIRSWSRTTQLPGRPFGAKGVLDIRGSIVEVFDLSAILGGSDTEPLPGHVVLVVSMEETNVGILVDSVSDIIFAEPEDFRDAPAAGTDVQSAKVSGLVQQDDRLIAILDLRTLFPSFVEKDQRSPALSHN
ncbi:MAG: chemotaxis protein CheW [Cypionkella sp.]